MTHKEFSAQDILDLAAKWDGDFIIPIPAEMRDTGSNKQSKFSVAWTPVKVKDLNGDLKPPYFKFKKQIIGGKARVPSLSENPKYMSISFRYMEIKEIEGGDYVPKDPNNPADVKKNADRVQKYHDVNQIAIRAFDLLDIALKKASDAMYALEKKRELKYNFNKDPRSKTINYISFKQQTYNATAEDSGLVTQEPLKYPLYRLRLPIYEYKTDGKIGDSIYDKNTKTRKYKPIVYDVRKMTKKNGYKDVAATVIKVDSNGRRVKSILDYETAPTFITCKSIANIAFKIGSLTSSKAGISTDLSITTMYIHRHKSEGSTGRHRDVSNEIEDLKEDLSADDNDGEEEEEEEVKEPRQRTKEKRSKTEDTRPTRVVTDRSTTLPEEDDDNREDVGDTSEEED